MMNENESLDRVAGMDGFWQNWLKGWCLAVGLFGVVLAGGALESTSGPIRMLLKLLKGSGEVDLDPDLRFSLGVMGPVTMGWSLTLLAAMKAANRLDKQAAKPIWEMITASAACWFVIDSYMSVRTGFWRNTIPNAFYMGAFLLPVARTGVLKG